MARLRGGRSFSYRITFCFYETHTLRRKRFSTATILPWAPVGTALGIRPSCSQSWLRWQPRRWLAGRPWASLLMALYFILFGSKMGT